MTRYDALIKAYLDMWSAGGSCKQGADAMLVSLAASGFAVVPVEADAIERKDAALRVALEALEVAAVLCDDLGYNNEMEIDAIAKIKEALDE